MFKIDPNISANLSLVFWPNVLAQSFIFCPFIDALQDRNLSL